MKASSNAATQTTAYQRHWSVTVVMTVETGRMKTAVSYNFLPQLLQLLHVLSRQLTFALLSRLLRVDLITLEGEMSVRQ